MGDKYLTTIELCEWLKISRATLDRWRKKGLPFVKVDKAVRFDKDEVEKWLKENSKN